MTFAPFSFCDYFCENPHNTVFKEYSGMEKYTEEKTGQREFYQAFLPRVDPSLDLDDILGDNNDGVINGNLLV